MVGTWNRREILAGGALLPVALSCSAPKPEPAPSEYPIPSVVQLPSDVDRGVCLAHSWQFGGTKGYGSDASKQSKTELSGAGVKWVSLTPFAWQKDLHSTEVKLMTSTSAGESDERLQREVQQCRDQGIKVMMKPHIWISYSEWRGHIQPDHGSGEGWAAWFNSYEAMILHYARLSQTLNLESLVIGLELASASGLFRDRWLEMISRIREVYSGALVYAANWNEAEQVVFWDAVDQIGIQFFAPLADGVNDDNQTFKRKAGEHLDGYGRLSKKHNKPVVLTEYGYKSILATAISPGTWPEHLPESAKAYDERNQARAYAATLGAVAERDFVKGVYLWKWFTDVHTDEEGHLGFSPRGKLGMNVLESAYKSHV